MNLQVLQTTFEIIFFGYTTIFKPKSSLDSAKFKHLVEGSF